jgi:predicted nucleotidyltransferase
MHEAISSKRKEIAEICREYGVLRLEVFGSAARANDFDPAQSDADFLVAFDPDSKISPLHEFFGLKSALSALIGRPVDLLEAGALRNPYVRRTIEQDREVLYAA